MQTLRSTQTLWPAAVVAGIKTEGWVSASQKLKFQALALDPAGKPQAGVTLEVRAVARIITTSRKRMVGGFYAYDNRTEVKDLGTLCSGKSDERGLLLCEAELERRRPGRADRQREGQARAAPASAASSVWVTQPGRALVRRRGPRPHRRAAREEALPARRDRASCRCACPFRYATALVAVEREGVIETQVVQLSGDDPTVELQVKAELGPERLRQRARAARPAARGAVVLLLHLGLEGAARMVDGLLVRGQEYVAPTAMVDLSKPAFRLGAGRDPRRHAGARADVNVTSRQAAATRCAARRRSPSRPSCPTASRGRRRGGVRRGRRGAARADAQRQLEPARRDAAAARLGRGDLAPRRWRSSAAATTAARRCRRAAAAASGPTRELFDTLLLWNPARRARRQRPGHGDGAAQRFADQLPHRRGGRRGHRPVRHRPDHASGHAGPADHQRPAAAGARGRPVPRPAHPAQHDAEAR